MQMNNNVNKYLFSIRFFLCIFFLGEKPKEKVQ